MSENQPDGPTFPELITGTLLARLDEGDRDAARGLMRLYCDEPEVRPLLERWIAHAFRAYLDETENGENKRPRRDALDRAFGLQRSRTDRRTGDRDLVAAKIRAHVWACRIFILREKGMSLDDAIYKVTGREESRSVREELRRFGLDTTPRRKRRTGSEDDDSEA